MNIGLSLPFYFLIGLKNNKKVTIALYNRKIFLKKHTKIREKEIKDTRGNTRGTRVTPGDDFPIPGGFSQKPGCFPCKVRTP